MNPISLSVALGIAGISAALKGLFSGIGSHKAAKENKKSEDLAEAEKRRADRKKLMMLTER